MEIRYLRHEDIDMQRWDLCISNSKRPLIYALSWYLDITSPGWDALVGGNYEAIMPLTWRKKYGLKYLIQPYYSQQLGIFGTATDASLIRKFFDAIPSRFFVVKINGNAGNDFSRFTKKIKQNCNYELDLSVGYDTISSRYSGNNNRNIRLSRRKKLSMSGIDSNEFIKFYSGFLEDRFNDLPQRHFEILKGIIFKARELKLSSIYGVYDRNGQVCSATFFLTAFDRMILLVSGSDEIGRKKQAQFFLLDNFIQMHSNKSLLLDFEGSNIPGVAYFYKGFGGKQVNYPGIYFNNFLWQLLHI